MARIKKISVILCAVLTTSFAFFATPAVSSEQAPSSALHKKKAAAKKRAASDSKSTSAKKTTVNKTSVKKTSIQKTTALKPKKTAVSHTATASKSRNALEKKRHESASVKKSTSTVKKQTSSKSKTAKHSAKKSLTTARIATPTACRKTRHGNKSATCLSANKVRPVSIAEAHKVRVKKAQKTAMNKLMQQIGKPYHWGGTSPLTGFDCSGLVWYAYKDLVKFRIPRTANEMYHLRDAAPVDLAELESGDLVFFRTQGRGTADHVGVYVGNGKFIQSPRSGREIQITSLSEDYWQRHYIGARRVMMPGTVR